VAEVAVNSAGKKPQDTPLREATGKDRRPAPSKIITANPTAMTWVALSRIRLFFSDAFSSFL